MFFRKETTPLQLYGKLPLAKDYLRVGCSDGLARSLREWLDESFSTGAADGGQPEPAGPLRFLLDGPGGAPVQGSFWPSSDMGGLRRFPFVVLVERKKRRLLEDFQEGLPRAGSIWEHLEARQAEFGALDDGQSFLAAMRSEKLAPKEVEPLDLPAVDSIVWSRALWPEQGARGLLELFERLRDLSGAGSRQPIRLPLVANLSSVVQAWAWWKLLEEAELLSGGQVPNLFFSQPGAGTEGPAFMTVFLEPLRSAHTPWLGRPHESLGAGDLACPGAGLAEPADPATERPLLEGLLHVWKRK